jgi:hypothetical protein
MTNFLQLPHERNIVTENLEMCITRAHLNLHGTSPNEDDLSDRKERELPCFKCVLARK